MSADNYGICPKCLLNATAEHANAELKMKQGYGKVEFSAFLKLKEEAEKPVDKEACKTLREDWELGTDEHGNFDVNYQCSCSKCETDFKYTYATNIYYKR
jgi:hypothetical protein